MSEIFDALGPGSRTMFVTLWAMSAVVLFLFLATEPDPFEDRDGINWTGALAAVFLPALAPLLIVGVPIAGVVIVAMVTHHYAKRWWNRSWA